MAKCMVSGIVFPQPVVSASHIWKYCINGNGLEEFGLRPAELNSPRNGLLLASEIEAAFDSKRVGFSYNLKNDKFTFHVLDSSLLEKAIVDIHDKKTATSIQGYARLVAPPKVHPEEGRTDPPGPVADTGAAASIAAPPAPLPAAAEVADSQSTIPTFKQLDNKEMPWMPPAVPFRRLLAWHYAMATLTAQRCSWYKSEKPFPERSIGKSDYSTRSPDVTWPSDDVLVLFDHAVSKSERDASDDADFSDTTGDDVAEA